MQHHSGCFHHLNLFVAVKFKAYEKRAINVVTFAVRVSPAFVVTLALPDNPKARLETNILLSSICNLNTLSFFMISMRYSVCLE